MTQTELEQLSLQVALKRGFEAGLFETQCSWLNDVQGSLTFKQVAHKVETIYKRDNAMTSKIKITDQVFELAVKQSRMKGKALKAAKESLVNGRNANEAADELGISKQSVSACIKRVMANALKMGACPCCGQVVKK